MKCKGFSLRCQESVLLPTGFGRWSIFKNPWQGGGTSEPWNNFQIQGFRNTEIPTNTNTLNKLNTFSNGLKCDGHVDGGHEKKDGSIAAMLL